MGTLGGDSIFIERHMFIAVSLQGLHKLVFNVTISDQHRQSLFVVDIQALAVGHSLPSVFFQGLENFYKSHI